MDGLESVTSSVASARSQKSAMVARLASVKDIDSLTIISEACLEDCPDVSEIISFRMQQHD